MKGGFERCWRMLLMMGWLASTSSVLWAFHERMGTGAMLDYMFVIYQNIEASPGGRII
jgi:hypothetical protein